MTVAVEQYRT